VIRFALVFAAALYTSLFVPAQQPASILPLPSDLPAPQTATVFGQRIVYYEAGEGPTLVLVHGFGSQALFDWGRVIEPLAKNHHVIAVDQIGFGRSDKPFIDYRIQTFVDFLGEFLRLKNVGHFALAGESLGGWIVANYTIEALSPANKGAFALPVPDRLILEDAAGHATIPHNLAVAASLQESAGVAIVFHDKSLVNEDFIRRNWELKMQANDGQTQRLLSNNPALASELVTGKLGAISIPTLVVWGGDDELIPLADGRDYAAGIPHAQLVIVPDCGHAPSLEKPREFLAAVEAFLR
jgi:pimeloyl-ACP methyl ester carboxylesterase